MYKELTSSSQYQIELGISKKVDLHTDNRFHILVTWWVGHNIFQ